MFESNKTIILICRTVAEEKIKSGLFINSINLVSTEKFIFHQISSMPVFFRAPFFTLLLYFNFSSLFQFANKFENLEYEKRLKLVDKWRLSPLNFKRDFIKFFDSLIVFDLACKENL